MGLAAVVRKGVAIADRVTGGTGGVQVPVFVTPAASVDGEGTETPGVTVEYRGFVERRKQLKRARDGRLVELDEQVLILGNVEIGVLDTLADDEGTLGPIIFIGGVRDPIGGMFFTEVWCGSSGGTGLGT